MFWFSEGESYQHMANKLTALTGTRFSRMNTYRHVRHALEWKQWKRKTEL
jgi:hypothetical protein